MCIQMPSMGTVCVSGKGTEFVTRDLRRKVTFLWSFNIFFYKWAVLHLSGSGQHWQSFKEKSRTEWVRDHGISNGEQSALAEKIKGRTRFLCCKERWGKKGKQKKKKERKEICWSCKLERSQLGRIWKRLSEGAFELLMKYEKPQQHYIPLPGCERTSEQ